MLGPPYNDKTSKNLKPISKKKKQKKTCQWKIQKHKQGPFMFMFMQENLMLHKDKITIK